MVLIQTSLALLGFAFHQLQLHNVWMVKKMHYGLEHRILVTCCIMFRDDEVNTRESSTHAAKQPFRIPDRKQNHPKHSKGGTTNETTKKTKSHRRPV